MTQPQSQRVTLQVSVDNKASKPLADLRGELRAVGTDTVAAGRQAAAGLATIDTAATNTGRKVKAGADDAVQALGRIDSATGTTSTKITDTGSAADRAMGKIRSAVQSAATEFATGFNEGVARASSQFDEVPRAADAAFGRIPEAAKSSADKAARRIEEQLRQVDMSTPLNQVAADTQPDMQQSGTQVGINFGKAFVAGVAAVGVGGLAAEAMDWEVFNAKTAGALRLAPSEVKAYGELAGRLYTEGVANSAEDANAVLQSLALNVGKGSIEQMDYWATRASAISDAYGQDIAQVTMAAGQAVRTGMAPDVETALDQIAAGFAAGIDRGQDYLDTINEYGVAFESLGLDGTKMGGLLAQALSGGARNADLAADAFKEFSIRSKDNVDSTRDAYQRLGLDADAMLATMAAGGEGASDGLQEVINRLGTMTDPVNKNAIAVGLFGTQAEDLQRAFDALNPATAQDAMGKVEGAATELGDTLYNTASSQAQTLYRTLKMGVVDFFLQEVVPAIYDVTYWFQEHMLPALKRLGDWITLTVVPVLQELWAWLGDNAMPVLDRLADWFENDGIPALQDFGEWVKRNKEWIEPLVVGVLAAYGAFKLWAIGVALVRGAFVLLNAIMTANPIGLILLAITALVAAFMWAYEHSEKFRKIVDDTWQAISAVAKLVWETVLRPVFEALGGIIVNTWEFFSDFGGNMQRLFTDLAIWVGEGVQGIKDWFAGVPQWIVDRWTEFRSWLGQLGVDVVTWIAEGIATKAKEFEGWVGGLVDDFAGWVGDKWDDLMGIGSDLLDWIGKGISDAAKDLWDWFSGGVDDPDSLVGGIWARVKALGTELAKIGGELMSGIAEGITGSDRIASAVGENLKSGGYTTGSAVSAGLAGGAEATGFGWLNWFFADGGMVPGYAPRQDTVPALLSPGEGVMVPELSRQVGATRLDTWNRQARSGVQVFAEGGIAGMAHDLGVPMGGVIAGLLAGKIGELGLGRAAAAPSSPVSDNGGGSAAASYVPSAGVAQWSSLVLQALAMVGQPASLLQTTLRRMNQESSGNPQAINLTDSNARKGTPSKGLMQVIDPTFRAYAEPGYSSNIYDPLSNILASMNYAISRYGTLAAAYNRAGGYDSGGWLPPGGGIGVNNLTEPEAVLTPSQWRSVEQLAAGARGSITFAPGAIVIQVDGAAGDPEQLAEQLGDVLTDRLQALIRDQQERSLSA